jgi:two-component system, chemotaxis family, protein-glutamate methylesterase/glutaminase
MTSDRIFVIGASAGGVDALRRLAATLPAEFHAPILVVLHVGNRPSILPKILSSAGPLPAEHAVDGEEMAAGRIYVAPPDHHMFIERHAIRLNRGAKEHHSRPAIDPLFRSAAIAHGSSVVGVVLTGRLDDGTAGLQAVKACNGIAIVQDPDEAHEPSMPMSALRYVKVDHCAPLASMAGIFHELLSRPTPQPVAKPSALLHEFDASLSRGDPMEHLEAIGRPSTFACPDCNGTLWEISGVPPRYRCHVGHAFTLRSLEDMQSSTCEDALWTGLRSLQEREKLLQKLRQTELPPIEQERIARALANIADRIERLRNLVEHNEAPIP